MSGRSETFEKSHEERMLDLIEEVFDTRSVPWRRIPCSRYKYQELILGLQEIFDTTGFGDADRCEIQDNCIPNIMQAYEELQEMI